MDGLKLLLSEVETEVAKQIDTKTQEVVADVKKQLDELKKYTPTIILQDGKKVGEAKGLQHQQLKQLITLLGANQNVLLVGMAGTGKTHSAEQVAEAVALDFYAMSVGAQTSKSDIVGYMDANGNYVTTHFRKAYEQGGIFVMDEIDAGNSNVLIILNSALSNGIMSFPDKMVKRHADFRFVATANTYGNGADRQYVGRNQLDGATLDRFTVIDWAVDENLEEKMVSSFSAGKAWFETVRELRRHVAQSGIRALITPRATQKGAMVYELGMQVQEMIEMTILPQIPQDKRDDIFAVTKDTWLRMVNKYPPTAKAQASTGTTAEIPETTSTEDDKSDKVTVLIGNDEWEERTQTNGRKRYFKNDRLVTKAEFEQAVRNQEDTQPEDTDFELPF